MLKEDIVKEASALFNVHPRDLMGNYRFRFVARARQALYLALRRRGWSYPQIGRFMNRDHSSVIYGTKVALHLEQRDPEYARKIEILTDMEYELEEEEQGDGNITSGNLEGTTAGAE